MGPAETTNAAITLPYPPEIHVLVEDRRWQQALPDVMDDVQNWCKRVYTFVPEAIAIRTALAKYEACLCVAVLLENDAEVQRLNRDFRGKDAPTNVLSFPAHEDIVAAAENDPVIREEGVAGLGDIVLAYETVEKEAKLQGKTLHDHLAHLVIHGCLHLLGFDHEDDGDAEAMEALEIQLLAQVSIANPYEKE